MLYSTSLILVSLLLFSFFPPRCLMYAVPGIMGYSCFNKVEFLAHGDYENNLIALLTERLSKEISNSGYQNAIVGGTSKSATEENTFVYGLA